MADSITTTRRGLLKTLTAAAAIAAAPAAFAATVRTHDTAILALFHRRRALVNAAASYPAQSDDELEDLFYREADAIEEEMMALPCTSAADFAAKFITASGQGTMAPDWLTDPICAEARFLTGVPV